MTSTKQRIDWAQVKARLERPPADDARRLNEVLRQRAIQFASRRRNADGNHARLPMLVMSLGAEQYALAVSSLAEVLPLAKCAPVPGAPPELLGVINRRGEICSVLSLSHMLQLPPSDGDVCARGYIVILRGGSYEVGLRVDRVDHVAAIALDELTPPVETAALPQRAYVRGITSSGVIVLDAAAILSHPVFDSEIQPEPPVEPGAAQGGAAPTTP